MGGAGVQRGGRHAGRFKRLSDVTRWLYVGGAGKLLRHGRRHDYDFCRSPRRYAATDSRLARDGNRHNGDGYRRALVRSDFADVCRTENEAAPAAGASTVERSRRRCFGSRHS